MSRDSGVVNCECTKVISVESALAGLNAILVYDVDGNDYYDLTAGMMCMVLGHSHPELTETMREQAELLVHESSWYSNPWAIEFAELITSTLPGNLKVVNFAVTGSEANEIAMRMAVATTRKHDIVSVLRGLHGGSLAAESVTSVGGGRKGGLGPFMIPARSNAILAPFCYRCPVNLTYPSCDIGCLKLSEDMMEHMTSKSVAGIIAESILVPGGMIVPPEEWLPRLKQVAKDWGSLLILDEVATGFGRSGMMFACEAEGVAPDLMCLAKGLTGGYLPMAATLTTERVFEAFLGPPAEGRTFFHGHTYSGNALAAAAALATLDIFEQDQILEALPAFLGAADETIAAPQRGAPSRCKFVPEVVLGQHRQHPANKRLVAAERRDSPGLSFALSGR